ncbi:MAG: phosphoribosyl-ATP diphosphatase [Pseudomonadales bacterium]|nr:phosphoribosyl-ATP diphosphatase [Pseudomonadales bacterium]
MDTINELTKILRERKEASPESSYVSALYSGGLEKILAKIAEESTETIDAARSAAQLNKENLNPPRDPHLIHEVADLWFHTMVLMVHMNQDPEWVLQELEARFGVSGHTEKANRDNSG